MEPTWASMKMNATPTQTSIWAAILATARVRLGMGSGRFFPVRSDLERGRQLTPISMQATTGLQLSG